MTTLHGSWIWYELMTPDAAASKAFYGAVVPGWTIDDHSQMPGMDYRFIHRAAQPGDAGGMTGGVMPMTDAHNNLSTGEPAGVAPGWYGYIGVDDCDAAVAAITERGGRVIMPADDIPGVGRIAMVRDCCGAAFYVMTPASDEEGSSTAFSSTLHGSCSWNELMAGHQAKALDFYPALFGWTLPPPMDMGEMGRYQFLDHDGIGMGAIMQKPAEAPAAQWVHYFRVSSINRAKDAATAAGGTIIIAPMEVPGGDWIIQGIDPQGIHFALVGGA